MLRPLLAGSFVALLLLGCPKDECSPLVITSDTECKTTQDCIDAKFQSLTCLDGVCRRPCLRDGDCVLKLDSDDECFNEVAPQGPVVCEDQLCIDGCRSDDDCGGLSCEGGRCVYFAESFEDKDRDGAVSLDQLGWNGIPHEVQNLRTTIAWQGLPRCNLGDERCAGLAAEGERFVVLEAVPTPEKGTPDVSLTCRSCACCLDCIANEPEVAARIPSCPVSGTVPIVLSCEVPSGHMAKCADVCANCNACMETGANVELGERLLPCEVTAAKKTCSSCPSCNAMNCEECRAANCPACTNVDSDACELCEMTSCPECNSCRACNVCSRALDCAVTDPLSQTCIDNRVACDLQGEDGCYPTPVHYPRAQLTDLEQSLVSPPIDLTRATGSISLQLEYVPFNVGEKYRPGIQGTPASEWPIADQEVVVQLCSKSCENESSWSDAMLVNGARASLPPLTQRGNGLSLGSQSSVDWGSGRVEIDLPQAMRTGEFRFRILPRLDADVQVGIDHILIRSRQ